MVAPGILKRFYGEIIGKTGVILTIPFDPAFVREAVKLGADAVKTTYFGPVPMNENALGPLSKVSHECDDWGMPLLAEVVPVKPDTHEVIFAADVVKIGCRQAAEIGADLVKTKYTGDVASFRGVVESCPVPVVILGGPRENDNNGMSQMAKDAIEAGAAGAAFGRGIWQQEDVAAATRMLWQVIHGIGPR
jgi:fructose-bisphosphate aldolase/2-amino-3,7-dideoxy-D-threo-hept-6-ulosonate synthase